MFWKITVILKVSLREEIIFIYFHSNEIRIRRELPARAIWKIPIFMIFKEKNTTSKLLENEKKPQMDG